MDINEMVGLVRAAVVSPGDTIVVTVDRYLTGPQLSEIGKHLKKRLPSAEIVMLCKGVSMEVLRDKSAQVGA